MTTASTREYKGYAIENDRTFGNKLVRSIGKGALPKKLKGRFTNVREAQNAIDLYLSSKGATNGESKPAG